MERNKINEETITASPGLVTQSNKIEEILFIFNTDVLHPRWTIDRFKSSGKPPEKNKVVPQKHKLGISLRNQKKPGHANLNFFFFFFFAH
jgi:hypothetical protein